jgi:hypothetical protein
MRQFEAGSKGREMEFYRSEADFYRESWRELVTATDRWVWAMRHLQEVSRRGDSKQDIIDARLEVDGSEKQYDLATRANRYRGPTSWPEKESWNRRLFIGSHQSAERQLALHLPRYTFPEIQLESVIEFINVLEGVQIVADWPLLAKEGIDRRVTITAEGVNEKVGTILSRIVLTGRDGRVGIAPFDNVIFVSTPAGIDRMRRRLKESFDRSDPAGQAILRSVQTTSLSGGVTLNNARRYLSERDKLELRIDGRILAAAREIPDEGFSLYCPVGLFLRLYLDRSGMKSAWAFRIVGNRLIIEPDEGGVLRSQTQHETPSS